MKDSELVLKCDIRLTWFKGALLMEFEESLIMVFVHEITCHVSLLSENLCSKTDICDILHYLEQGSGIKVNWEYFEVLI